MKYSVLILLVFSVFSCNAQKKQIDITGNWYLSPHKGIEGFTYKEIFIDDKVISVYQDVYGFNIQYFYTQQNNALYLIINDEKIKHSDIKTIDKNTLSFKLTDDSILIYKRIGRNELTFEDLLNTNPYNEGKHKTKLEGDYLEAFKKRKEINTLQE